MGRKPTLVLDARTRRELNKLAEYQLTTREAAAVLGVSTPALIQWFNVLDPTSSMAPVVLNRQDLIRQLKTVKPALTTRRLVPQLGCFWFTGKEVMAHNYLIAI
jgi:hypothetical protein